jgi:PaREP6 domain containing protein
VSYAEKLKKWEELEREARELRRRFADWGFIESLPPRLREALKYYIETGDIRRAARLAGLELEDFRELLRRANVPVVV